MKSESSSKEVWAITISLLARSDWKYLENKPESSVKAANPFI